MMTSLGFQVLGPQVLGPHAAFIIASYLAAFVLIGGLGFWIIRAHRRASRTLAAMDPRQSQPRNPP